ncbi:MAG: glycosyltransferase, partial [Candidatus Limnocylindrales bacterium]|nr:glycosyltransferase [Candidatus Limnocylindrales bacterium]
LAAGRPAVAYARGGAPEIVSDGVTGFLFMEQTVQAIGAGMLRALNEPLDPAALVRSARRFDAAIFDAAIRDLVEEALAERRFARPSTQQPSVDRRAAATVTDGPQQAPTRRDAAW